MPDQPTTPSSPQKFSIQLKAEQAGARHKRALQALGEIPVKIKAGRGVYKDVKGKARETEKEFPHTREEDSELQYRDKGDSDNDQDTSSGEENNQETRDKEQTQEQGNKGDGEDNNNQETRDKGDGEITKGQDARDNGDAITKKQETRDKEDAETPRLTGSTKDKKQQLRGNPQWVAQALADSGGLDKLGSAGAYSDNWRERWDQKKAAEQDIKDDYGSKSFAAQRSGGGQVGAPGKGQNIAGKVAGAGISAIVEGGGIPSAVFLYGLALLNDFPDIAGPFLKLFTGNIAAIVDFLFDVFVFLGFRYFLRNHLNVPGIKLWLTIMAIAEIVPIPGLDNIDILPFWTILAWVALRKIRATRKETQEMRREEQARRKQAALEAEAPGNAVRV